MSQLKLKLLVIGMMTLFSCNSINQDKERANNVETQTEKTSADQPNRTTESKYLSQSELTEFLKHAERIEINSNYPKPFDALEFDKVIAYDFDGREELYPSVINHRNGRFAPVVLRQKELNLEQIDFLIDFLTDNDTYGEQTAACFIPHLGIVFYHGEERKYVVDICLDCNYLISTTEIPGTQHKKIKFKDGTSYGLRGFSEIGKMKIIELSKQLNLDYGIITLE